MEQVKDHNPFTAYVYDPHKSIKYTPRIKLVGGKPVAIKVEKD